MLCSSSFCQRRALRMSMLPHPCNNSSTHPVLAVTQGHWGAARSDLIICWGRTLKLWGGFLSCILGQTVWWKVGNTGDSWHNCPGTATKPDSLHSGPDYRLCVLKGLWWLREPPAGGSLYVTWADLDLEFIQKRIYFDLLALSSTVWADEICYHISGPG